MKILLANTTAHPRIGGIENSLRYISRELLEAGHEVKILALRFSAKDPAYAHDGNVDIIRFPCSVTRWPHQQQLCRVLAIQEAMPKLLESFSPDVVWCRSVPVGVGIRRSGFRGPLFQIFPTNARMNSRGTFLQTRGLPVRRRLLLLALWPVVYFAHARLERELAGQCNAIAFSENMQRELLRDYPREITACKIVSPGVDAGHFSPVHGETMILEIEQTYGLNRREINLLYVGRLASAKNIPMLMRALAAMQTPARLCLVGDGPEKTRLEACARKLGLGNRVVFAGPQHELLPGFYAMSRVTVMPTTTESFGQVFLESLACGTPVVGFACDRRRVLTATDEIVRDGKTGILVRNVHARGLAAGIEAVASMTDHEYSAMSQYARKNVIERFTWQNFVERMLKLSEDGCRRK